MNHRALGLRPALGVLLLDTFPMVVFTPTSERLYGLTANLPALSMKGIQARSTLEREDLRGNCSGLRIQDHKMRCVDIILLSPG